MKDSYLSNYIILYINEENKDQPISGKNYIPKENEEKREKYIQDKTKESLEQFESSDDYIPLKENLFPKPTNLETIENFEEKEYTLNEEKNIKYTITKKDNDFLNTYNKNQKKKHLFFILGESEKSENKVKKYYPYIKKFIEEKSGKSVIYHLYYLLIYKYNIAEIYKDAGKILSENLKEILDNLNVLIFNLEIEKEKAEHLLLEMIVNNSENLIKSFSSLPTFKDNTNNFYNGLKLFITVIANECFDINNCKNYFSDLKNCEKNIFNTFSSIIQSDDRSKLFVDFTCWNSKKSNDNYEESFIRFYLFFFRYNKPFFSLVLNNQNNQKKSIYLTYDRLLTIYNTSLGLKDFDVIQNDDLFALIMLKKLNSIKDEYFKYIHLMIPLIKILQFSTNLNEENKQIIINYFEIIKNIFKYDQSINVIYYISEDFYGKFKNTFIKNNNKINDLFGQGENEIFNTLKFNINDPSNQYLIDYKFHNKISYVYPLYRLKLDETKLFLLNIFKNNINDNSEINIYIDFEAIIDDKNTKFYDWLINKICKEDKFKNDSKFKDICKQSSIQEIIKDYINKNIKNIFKKSINQDILNKIKDDADGNKYIFDKIIGSEIINCFCEIYNFLKKNKIIDVLMKEDKSYSKYIDNFELFQNAIIDDFKKDRIVVNNKEDNSSNALLFYNIISESFINNNKQNILENYNNYRLGLDNNLEESDRDNYISQLINGAKSLPSFINYLKTIDDYIKDFIIDLNSKIIKMESEDFYTLTIQLISKFHFVNKDDLEQISKNQFKVDYNNRNISPKCNLFYLIKIKLNEENPKIELNKILNSLKIVIVYSYFEINKKYIFLIGKIYQYLKDSNVLKEVNIQQINNIYDKDDQNRSVERRELIESLDILLEFLLSKFDGDTNFYITNFDFLNYIISISNCINNPNALSTYSKQQKRLKSIKLLLDHTDKTKIDKKSLNEYNNIIKIINKNMINSEFNESELKKEYNELTKLQKYMNHFDIFISKFFTEKLKRFSNDNQGIKIKKEIISIIMNNYNYLIKSKEFFRIVFYNVVDTDKLLKNISKPYTSENERAYLSDLSESVLIKNDIVEDTLILSDNPLLSIIDEYINNKAQNYEAIEQIIINIFENELIPIFNVDSKELFVNEEICSYINTSINKLNSYLDNNGNDVYDYNQIKKLYCISFLKIFFNGYFRIIYNEKIQIDFSWVNKIITETEENKEISNNNMKTINWIIKLYVLKQLRYISDSFNSFSSFNFINHQMLWTCQFKFREKIQSTFDFFFLSYMGSNDKTEYDNFMNKTNELKNTMILLSKETFRTGKYDNDIKNLLKSDNFDIFIDFCINNYLSNCIDNEYLQSLEYNEFSMWIENLMKSDNLFNFPGVDAFFHILFKQKTFEDDVLNVNKKNQIKSLKEIKGIFIMLKLALCFVIRGFNDLNQIEMYINVNNKNNSNNYLIIDILNHCNNNMFNSNKYKYQIMKGYGWKLVNPKEINISYKDKVNFDKENKLNNMINDFNSLSKTYNLNGINLSLSSYDVINNQSYPESYDEIVLKTKNKLTVFIIYSLYYYATLPENIKYFSSKNKDKKYEQKNQQELFDLYNDLVKYLHLINIDNETIFFNVLYYFLKKNLPNNISNIIDSVRGIVDTVIITYQDNKCSYIAFIHHFSEFDIYGTRNLIEDQKIIYKEKDRKELNINSNVYDIYPYLLYFYCSVYPSVEHFEYSFRKIYHCESKYPLTYYVINNNFNLNDINKTACVNLINEIIKKGNDHSKIDVGYLLSYEKSNLMFFDSNNFNFDESFLKILLVNSYRNIYGKDEVIYCNGDVICYDYEGIENDLYDFLLEHFY